MYKYHGNNLSQRQEHFNNVHEHVRNRAEQIINLVKSHRIFKKKLFRGSIDIMKAATKIVGHTTAHHLRRTEGRFDRMGPWQHVY